MQFFNNFFSTTSLNFIKSTGTGFNLSTSNLYTLLFKLFRTVGTLSNLSISNLSISDFKLAKSAFLANFNVSAPVTVSFLLIQLLNELS